MPISAIRILLVEDDELFRLGLRVRLQQNADIESITEAEDGEIALALAHQTSFDLVLLDIGLPGIGGIETCRQLKASYPTLPILILTSREDSELLKRLIELGIQGYCLKGIAAENLILAVRSVAAGASWWDATSTQTIRQTLAKTTIIEPDQNPLTQREREVLELLTESKTNPEIAQILYISAGTVRVHVHSILHKLNAGDRIQAVLIAKQQGWLSIP